MIYVCCFQMSQYNDKICALHVFIPHIWYSKTEQRAAMQNAWRAVWEQLFCSNTPWQTENLDSSKYCLKDANAAAVQNASISFLLQSPILIRGPSPLSNGTQLQSSSVFHTSSRAWNPIHITPAFGRLPIILSFIMLIIIHQKCIYCKMF